MQKKHEPPTSILEVDKSFKFYGKAMKVVIHAAALGDANAKQVLDALLVVADSTNTTKSWRGE